MAFAVRSRMDGKDKSVVCSHCKCSGHEAESCFVLIGIWIGGVIDHLTTTKLEDAVGDNNPHSSEKKLGVDVVL